METHFNCFHLTATRQAVTLLLGLKFGRNFRNHYRKEYIRTKLHCKQWKNWSASTYSTSYFTHIRTSNTCSSTNKLDAAMTWVTTDQPSVMPTMIRFRAGELFKNIFAAEDIWKGKQHWWKLLISPINIEFLEINKPANFCSNLYF